jgi:hypothetical protein
MHIFSFFKILLLKSYRLAVFILIAQLTTIYASNLEEEAEEILEQYEGMNFKVGFEFQEANNLCSWAENDFKAQKKPLFFLMDKVSLQPLWHVVIDTSDIEFVTRPFSYKEENALNNCIISIVQSVNKLEKLFSTVDSISFDQWTNKLKEISKGLPFKLELTDNYPLVEHKMLTKPEQWKPTFMPQVTIQHPLQYTIALYFGLFGFDSSKMIPFSASLPCRDLFLASQQQADSERFAACVAGYNNKMNGLVFLHALTLVEMTPIEIEDDAEFLQETLDCLEKFSQVDPKMKLTLMSRRPFSSMFADLNIKGDYYRYFISAMSLNRNFMTTFKVPTLFNRANYAEQFFDPQTGSERSLLEYSGLFQADFFEKNKEVLTKLLERGIVSTAMIRNFKDTGHLEESLEEIFDNQYQNAIKTVQDPNKTYIIDIKELCVKDIPYAYDTLSPPCFLDSENSMGRFKDLFIDKEKKYGEAIVEVRAIKHVQPWFLKKCGLQEDLSGEFLVRVGDNLVEEANKLFIFLRKFGTEQQFNDIYYLGMPYAVRKY